MPTDTMKTASAAQQASKQSTKSKKSNQPSNKANSGPKKTASKKKPKDQQQQPSKRGAKRKERDASAGTIVPVPEKKERLSLATNPDEESIGQFTKAKRLFQHVLEEVIEEAGESGLIQPVMGTVNDPEGATAESLGLVHVRDIRASKTFTELIRVISQAFAGKEFQRGKVLMQLMGKKTLGMDVVHAIRFLANSNNCHATSHLVQRSEADMLEMIMEDARTNYDKPKGQLEQIKRSFALVGREINEYEDAEDAVNTARDAERVQAEEGDAEDE